MKRFIYMVLSGTKYKVMRNKKDIMRLAKHHKCPVYALPLSSWNECSWDVPTFQVVADKIADFTEVKQ